MKPFRVTLLLTIAALSGCTERQPLKAKANMPAPPRSPVQNSAPRAISAPRTASEPYLAQMQHLGSVLEQLVADPQNAIPDSVLNHAACFVMFSAPLAATAAKGFASCRNESAWTSPIVLKLSQVSGAHGGTDVLLLLLSSRAINALQRGRLAVGPELQVSAGPMERSDSILPDFELQNQDIFGYECRRNTLTGATLKTAEVTADASATRALYGHGFAPSWLLARSTYTSSVTNPFVTDVSSFFNAITPAGIIIHHSVLIPAKDLPDAERAVDRFHYKRGFAISCFGRTYHIAYHYLILPDGEIRAGRPERCEGAHARGYNSYLGIALIGDFSSQDNPRGQKGPRIPTPQQMAALVKLCRRLREQYKIPLQRIMPHSEVSRTRCPGDGFAFKTVLAQLEVESKAGE
jgi:lipid-binding SYLF domain-containing protein